MAEAAEAATPAVTRADLRRWADRLAGAAAGGRAVTRSLYERERFEEVAKIAADIRAATAAMFGAAGEEVAIPSPHGVRGQPPAHGPKTAVGALVGNDEGEILLVQRADSGAWLFPAGMADVGYSPAEVAVKETAEETGMAIEPVPCSGGTAGSTSPSPPSPSNPGPAPSTEEPVRRLTGKGQLPYRDGARPPVRDPCPASASRGGGG